MIEEVCRNCKAVNTFAIVPEVYRCIACDMEQKAVNHAKFIKCENCGAVDHKTSECGYTSSAKTKTNVCSYCGETGHSAGGCEKARLHRTQEKINRHAAYFGHGPIPVPDLKDIQKLNEGIKHDQEKDRIELFPPEALFAISRVLTFGAKKYSDRNWERGMAWSRCFGACMRHLWAWWAGCGPTTKSFLFGDLDEETSMSHLWHAGCCVVFLISYEERNIGTDDRHRVSE